jgi:hypothetical protein
LVNKIQDPTYGFIAHERVADVRNKPLTFPWPSSATIEIVPGLGEECN